MLVIDGENCILGRLASEVAKKALNGETIKIVNAEKILITGNPKMIIEEHRARLGLRDVANPEKSPKFPRRPDLFVKRVIRGMLPRKTERGRDALKRIFVYLGVPEGFENISKIAEAKELRTKAITVDELCKALGWKG
jgi:large subunit ribosomal protein L13